MEKARAAARGMIPLAVNRTLIALIITLNVLQFFVVPLVLLPLSPDLGWILAVCVLATPTHWSVIHEAVHGHLLSDRRSNERWARVLSVLFGSPFQLLRFGHLMHHRFNRTAIQRSDVSNEFGQIGLSEKAWYFFMMTIGLYLFELAAAFFALLPDSLYRKLVRAVFGKQAPDGRTMKHLAEKQLGAAPGRNRMRLDGFLICLLFAVSFLLYDLYWWMLAAALLMRGIIISLLDNVYHYGNKLDDTKAGYNLNLPIMLEKAFLYFNLHEVHHTYPNKPWSELPALFDAGSAVYHHSFAHAMIRQFSGLIPEPIAARGDRDLRSGSGTRKKH